MNTNKTIEALIDHLSTGKPVILSVWRALEFARLLGTGKPVQIDGANGA